MRKTLLGILLILSIGNITNAQIKVVGDDYKDSLSGAKNYYDMDVDFDALFPNSSPLEHRHEMGSTLCDNREENLVGDTIFIPSTYDYYSYSNLYESMDAGMTFYETKTIPAGYYVIKGYIFCNDNSKKIGLKPQHEYSYRSTHGLKEAILESGKYKLDIKEYLEYILISPADTLNGNKDVVYATGRCDIGGHNVMYLNFYNVVKELFVGKKVCIYRDNGQHLFFEDWAKVSSGTLFRDDIRDEMLKLQDEVFEVKDVVFKDGFFVLVLNGDLTGSFSQCITSVKTLCEIDWDHKLSDSNIPYIVLYEDYRYHVVIAASDYPLLQQKVTKKLQAERQKNNREQQLQEQQRIQKQAKEKDEFKSRMIAKYGDGNGMLVGNRQIAIGMTKEMCKDAWGTPINTYRTTTSFGQSEVWCYNYKTRVYFYNGRVVQIDD